MIQVNTVDIVEDLVALMGQTITISGVVDNGDNTYDLTINDVYWLRPSNVITFSGVDYMVLVLIDCNEIRVSGASAPIVGDTYSLAAPFYFHGTPIATNDLLTEIISDVDKYPAVYCLENLTESFIRDPADSILDRESPVVLFFMDRTDFNDFRTDEHYTNAINPMRRSVQVFEELTQNRNGIGEYNFTLTNHAKLGVQTTNKGATSKIFNDDLAAVEFSATLPIHKDLVCALECK